MEVILLEHVDKLGGVGAVVNVKNGYARNYLIPTGKALRATNENKSFFEAERSKLEAEDNKRKAAAEAQSKKVKDQFFVIIRQAGEDDRLYGSVTSRDVASTIIESGVELDRNQVSLDQPIKYIGVTPVRVALHPEVVVNVNVNVARTEAEADEAKKEFLNPTKKEEKPEAQEEVETKQEGEEAPQAAAEEPKSEDAPEVTEKNTEKKEVKAE